MTAIAHSSIRTPIEEIRLGIARNRNCVKKKAGHLFLLGGPPIWSAVSCGYCTAKLYELLVCKDVASVVRHNSNKSDVANDVPS